MCLLYWGWEKERGGGYSGLRFFYFVVQTFKIFCFQVVLEYFVVQTLKKLLFSNYFRILGGTAVVFSVSLEVNLSTRTSKFETKNDVLAKLSTAFYPSLGKKQCRYFFTFVDRIQWLNFIFARRPGIAKPSGLFSLHHRDVVLFVCLPDCLFVCFFLCPHKWNSE